MFYRYEKVSIICCLNIIKLSVIFMFILIPYVNAIVSLYNDLVYLLFLLKL